MVETHISLVKKCEDNKIAHQLQILKRHLSARTQVNQISYLLIAVIFKISTM